MVRPITRSLVKVTRASGLDCFLYTRGLKRKPLVWKSTKHQLLIGDDAPSPPGVFFYVVITLAPALDCLLDAHVTWNASLLCGS